MRKEIAKYFDPNNPISSNKMNSDEIIAHIETGKLDFVASVAANSYLGEFFQKHLCTYHDPIVREVLASRDDVSKYSICDILVADTDKNVQLALANNPYIPVYILMTLSKSIDSDIKAAVANNQNATPEIKAACIL